MLLALDIGNSSIKFGIFNGSTLLNTFSIPTKLDYTADEIVRSFEAKCQFKCSSVIAVSVVPELNDVIAAACFEMFAINAFFVDSTFDLGMKINYNPPASAGADRIVNVFSATKKYGMPLIVCSFGTATTIDVSNSNGDYIGGLIAPGIQTMADALHLKTAKLPRIQVKKPQSVVNNTTESSIKSGVFYGHIAMVEGLIERIRSEQRAPEKLKIIAAGGFAKLIAAETDLINVIDENLTLDGLRLIADKMDMPQ